MLRRILPLPQILAIAHNLSIKLYRNAGFFYIAKARRKCQFNLNRVLSLFIMKQPCVLHLLNIQIILVLKITFS